MATREDGTPRPVAVMVFGVLAVLGFIVTGILSGYTVDPSDAPSQPDQAIAAQIEQELDNLEGVKRAQVIDTVECIDDCSETRRSYGAKVELRASATAEQISAVVAKHDEIAPSQVGMQDLPITLMLTPDKTLKVAPVHYGFGVTQAAAFLSASAASAQVAVDYGPPSSGESPLLSIAANVPGLVCENADAALAQVVPALSSAATAGGISFSSVRFDCGAAKLEAGIAAGSVFQPTYSAAATAVDRISRDIEGFDTGVVRELSVAFDGVSTILTVELNDGQQVGPELLDEFDSIIESLTTAGAADPQLDLKNY